MLCASHGQRVVSVGILRLKVNKRVCVVDGNDVLEDGAALLISLTWSEHDLVLEMNDVGLRQVNLANRVNDDSTLLSPLSINYITYSEDKGEYGNELVWHSHF